MRTYSSVKPLVLVCALCTVLGALAQAESSTIEGQFGRVEVNTERPSVTALTLRRADGSLEPHSLLSPKGDTLVARHVRLGN